MENINIIEIKIKSISPLFLNDGEDVLIDKKTNKAYLPATVVAGAFRSYLESIGEDVDLLFGYQGEKNTQISKIYISDSFADILGFERRVGIRVDEKSGTNRKGALIEKLFLSKGINFKIVFKINSEKDSISNYTNMLYKAIKALDKGIIRFGGNKSNGLGIFKLESASLIPHDLSNIEDVEKYLLYNTSDRRNVKEEILNITIDDERIHFKLSGKLVTPLLIGEAEGDYDHEIADNRSIKSGSEYIIPGSSFKGILRSRMESISNYFGNKETIKRTFGEMQDKKNILSNIFVKEPVIDTENYQVKEYNKIKIDKFTGGVMDGALMKEEPVQGEIEFEVVYNVKNNKEIDDYNISLLTLALRDLATENLPLGGNTNIGRGRFKGDSLIITKNQTQSIIDFTKKTIDDNLNIKGKISNINSYVEVGDNNE